jgi:acetyl esterase/lipase
MRSQVSVAAATLFATCTLLIWLSAEAQDRREDRREDRRAGAAPFVQVPDTVSPEARKFLESLVDPAGLRAMPAPGDLPGWKRAWQAAEAANEPRVQATLKRYQPTIAKRMLGGVPALDIKPKHWKDNGKVLVHAHGGAYAMNSARSRLQSSVPAADATGLRVLSVDYTLAPFAKWQKVTDEIRAVLAGLQTEGYKLKDIAVYGESAGGALARISHHRTCARPPELA